MKRFFTNSKLAKALLFEGYSTIAIGWFVFSKLDELPQSVKTHETIHSLQWTEVTSVAFVLLSFFSWIISPYILLLSPIVYYIWYVVEWLIRLPFGNAYRNIMFEKEAFDNQHDERYLLERELFSWLKIKK
jgi:hypothetical protein